MASFLYNGREPQVIITEDDERFDFECPCKDCARYRTLVVTHKQFDFDSETFDFKFPKIEGTDDEKKVNFEALATVPPDKRLPCYNIPGDVVRFVTYYTEPRQILTFSLHDFVLLCAYLTPEDLSALITTKQLALRFLQRVCMYFIRTWHAFLNGCAEAEWSGWEMRRFLAHIITFPIIAEQVNHVFTTTSYWPEIGPVQIIETLCLKHLMCMDTLTLLVNLTRIEGVKESFKNGTQIIEHIQDKFWPACRVMQQADNIGGLFIHLLTNLTAIEEFTKFVIDANAGYFVTVVLLDLLSNQAVSPDIQKGVWHCLRNLSIIDDGRKSIMANINIFLGPILLPIAGPERYAEEEMGKLPVELQYLPESKVRVEDKEIRSCVLDILYSLCRFRKDRIALRDYEAYQILKHYHTAEEDPELLKKTEDVVNILIRKEGSEITVDDLLEGLSIKDEEEVKDEDVVPSSSSQA